MIWAISLLRMSILIVCGFAVLGCIPTSGFAQDAEALQAEIKEVTTKPKFVYSPRSRDPFVPLFQQIHKKNGKAERDKGPLEKYELSQFRLMALLIVEGSPRAMVKAPDGKGYTVKPGDLIGANGGVVKRIETKTVVVSESSGQRIEKSPDQVVVEETGVDNFTGKEFKEYRYIQM